MTPEEARIKGKIGGLKNLLRHGRSAVSAPARKAFLQGFPDRDSLSNHMRELAIKSVEARKRKVAG
jgi:hypothetical protein